MQVAFRSKEKVLRLARLLKSTRAAVLFLFLFQVISIAASAQANRVKGHIVNEVGDPVPNASVAVKGGAAGVNADANGNFEINAAGNAVLLISSVGYSPIEVAVENRTDIEVTLSSLVANMEDVVVIGYGTSRKADLTGAVSSVNLETMADAPNTNIGQYLQGTVPGLNVGLSTFAGGTPPINIRGQVTLGGNQNVLIILDGIQYNGSLSSINPDDIASIDVLKDASSTAVYGAQAANGVILITSRKGRAGEKTRVAFSSAYTTQSPTVSIRPLNRAQYLEQFKDAFWRTAFTGPDYTTPDPSFDVAKVVDATMADPNRTAVLANDYDWWTEATDPGHIFENNLSVSGGSSKFNYLLSGGVVDQKGFIVNDYFNRKSIRANLESKLFDFWKVGLVSSGSFVDQDGAEPTIGIIAITSPLLVPYDADGNLIPNPTNTVVPNPFLGNNVDDRERHQYYFANIYSDLNIPFIPGLNYRINFGNNFRTDQHYNASQYGAGLTGSAYKENQDYYDYTFDNIVTYNKEFGRHALTVTGLYGAIERKYSRTYAEGTGFARLNLSYNNIQSANIKNITTNAWSETLNYQMGRVAYRFDEKYLLTATLRRDGFSGFAQNYKYATFPSLGLGWILSSEDFLSNVTAVNFLKLRATYGSIGNQTSRYYSLARVSTNAAYVFGDGGGTAFGQQVQSLSNPNLRWEKTQGIDIGVDFTLLNNRFTGTIDYYNNSTYDLLFNVNIPTVTGFGQIATNVGKIRNTGLEAALTYQILAKKNLTWSATFNFWKNTNKILELTGVDANGDGREDDLVSSGLFIGKSIQTIYNYQEDGIYQLNDPLMSGFVLGSLRVVDQNKDGDITPDDRIFIGRQEPAYRFSFYNNFSYKGITLSFFINSVQGGKNGYLGNNTRLYYRDDNSIRNNDLDAVDYWSPRNPNGRFPRVIDGSHSKIEPNIYQSRSFVRLQDVSVGYNLPASVLGKIHAQSINFYISAKNLVTWTKWEGWDPETLVPITTNGVTTNEPNGLRTDGRPAMRAITFGLHLTF